MQGADTFEEEDADYLHSLSKHFVLPGLFNKAVTKGWSWYNKALGDLVHVMIWLWLIFKRFSHLKICTLPLIQSFYIFQ